MKFRVDAQLPPSLAAWLSAQFVVEAVSLRDLGLSDSTDSEVFKAAHQAKVVVISKDCDFVELASRYGAPPQLLWVTSGNVTNRKPQQVFSNTFPAAMALLTAGQAIVEAG
jgi:predicted nuclease of predicted toxin-antitoxin system